jgi:hypothetical protein
MDERLYDLERNARATEDLSMFCRRFDMEWKSGKDMGLALYSLEVISSYKGKNERAPHSSAISCTGS